MKRLFLTVFAGLLLALLAGCATTGPFDGQYAFTDPTADTTGASAVPVKNTLSPDLLRPGNGFFTVGPGDRLEIEIVGNAASRAPAVVGPDGKIYYHLLRGLDVWGLTLDQTRALLEKELAKFMTEPQVAVSLREVASKHVWVLGRLNKPGIYPISGPMTLLEALALAGGTSRSTSQITTEELADLRHSFVMRQGQLLPVDFYRLLREGDTSQNI